MNAEPLTCPPSTPITPSHIQKWRRREIQYCIRQIVFVLSFLKIASKLCLVIWAVFNVLYTKKISSNVKHSQQNYLPHSIPKTQDSISFQQLLQLSASSSSFQKLTAASRNSKESSAAFKSFQQPLSVFSSFQQLSAGSSRFHQFPVAFSSFISLQQPSAASSSLQQLPATFISFHEFTSSFSSFQQLSAASSSIH